MFLNKVLSDKILRAVTHCGRDSIKNIISVIEEELTPEEVKETKAFLKWAFFDWEERGFGSMNIYIKWNEWKMSLEPASAKKKSSSMFGKSFSRQDSTAMTVKELFALLTKLNQDPKMSRELFEQPLIMSSDEEGNEMLSLAMVEVSKKGRITLYPAYL